MTELNEGKVREKVSIDETIDEQAVAWLDDICLECGAEPGDEHTCEKANER